MRVGNVSLQFHCIYDNEFTMCKPDTKFSSEWQFQARLQPQLRKDDEHMSIQQTTEATAAPEDDVLNQTLPTNPLFVTPWMENVDPTSEPAE